MSASVRAFRPRKYDPPKFVAYNIDELADLEGGYIGAGQCDGCGSAVYQIRVRMIAPGTRQFEAVCTNDPDDEYQHPEPCETAYPISIWDEDLVEF